jgi:hypothetical protein
MIFSVFDQMGLSAAFSPDGKHLIVGTFSGLHIVDAFTGKDVVSYSGRQMIGRTATFSHDGKLLFVGRTDGSLRVLDAATGHVVRDVPAHSEAILSLTLSGDGKTLASGSSDSTVLLWDVAALPKEPAASKQNLSPQVLQALWADLAGGDGVKAYQAINSLAVASTDSVPFLKSRLKAIAPLDQKLLEQLIEDLNNPKFPSREKASASLEKLGDLAGPALKAKLAAKPPLEVQQRIEKLLTKLNSTVENPESLQALRGIEALERIGGPEALAVLADLAKGAPGHRLTEDASASVQRLQNQYKKK